MSTSISYPNASDTPLMRHVANVRQLLGRFPLSVIELAMRVGVASVFFKSGLTKIASWDVTVQLFADEYRVPLLPPDVAGRARVRALALDIACEIHPLNNLRVLRYLVHDLKLSEDDKNRWYRHWVETGLEVVERQLAAQPARYCHGDLPTLADVTLVPQVFNAQRFDCRLDHVPQVMRVFDACMALDAFEKTRPEACPDAA